MGPLGSPSREPDRGEQRGVTSCYLLLETWQRVGLKLEAEAWLIRRRLVCVCRLVMQRVNGTSWFQRGPEMLRVCVSSTPLPPNPPLPPSTLKYAAGEEKHVPDRNKVSSQPETNNLPDNSIAATAVQSGETGGNRG